MSQMNLIISIDDEHQDRILEVADNLQAAGMKVDQLMEPIGVIVGSIDSSKAQTLKSVEGVANVEVSRSIQLAPPESDIQ